MIIERVPCGLCKRLAPEGYLLCTRCALDLQHALDDIVRICATLADPEALLPRAGAGGRGSPGYRSTSPANDSVIALSDRRTIARTTHDPHDVLGVLHGWAEEIREQTGIGVHRPRCSTALRMYRTVTGAVGTMIRMRDWIARQDFAADLVREVLQVRDRLSDANGETRGRVRIGRCITMLLHPETLDPHPCGYLLQASPDDTAIRCPRCSAVWPRLYWPGLGKALRAANTAEGDTT